MSKSKGFTLVETLFAFQVYLCVIYLLVLMSQSISIKYNHLTSSYENIIEKEEQLYKEIDIADLIDKVLH